MKKKENWTIGKIGHTVITDTCEGFQSHTPEYFGGSLVCESVLREKDVHLISAAPDMLEGEKQ